MADILKFTDNPIIDEGIEEYKYHEYDPITGTNLNNGGDIRISIESQYVFTHPSESYLIFEGRLTKADGTAYANTDEVALTNNAIMHLFSRIEYYLSNQLIESLNYPGQATTMLGLLKYKDDFSIMYFLQGMHICILIQSPTVKGIFSFRISLKHIFVFVKTMTKLRMV